MSKIGPLPWQTPIVDPNSGKPSPFFVRLWQDSFLRTDALDTALGGIGAKADKTTTISAGTGLSGGGDLSANRTISLSAGLDALTDVTLTSPTNTQVLGFEAASGQWKNTTLPAGYTPSAPAVLIPTLNAPWINYGGGFGSVRYLRNAEGLVTIEGLIQAPGGSPTASVVIFNLLPGYRPPATQIFTTWGGGGSAAFTVEAGGDVVMRTGNTAFTSLCGISFYV
jgi:hypothetical protein